ncbi:MAG: DMP19 family protein [Planctomycetes bacterium]|nr:DMP19 family protein [Planctomycetota bacterium]
MIAGLADDEMFWALLKPAWVNPKKGTRGQRAFACAIYFIRDLENGGIHQALTNRRPLEIQEVLTALDTLGADSHAQHVRKCINEVFGAKPPTDFNAWRDKLGGLSHDWITKHMDPHGRPLDDETQLWPMFRRFIATHPEDFFTD